MSFDAESRFWSAITSKDLASAFSLLYSGVNPNSVHESTGSTPMHIACREGDVALSMLLFTKGANVNARDLSGQTPLHCAALGGHGQIITFLLKAGADVSAQDGTHQLAEELAFHHNHTAVFRMLLSARLGSHETKRELAGGRNTLKKIQKAEKDKDKEQKQLEKQERKLLDKDHSLKQEVMELSVEKTRLEAIPAHLATKKEKAQLAQVHRQLSKLDSKHQKYSQDIKEVRRTSFEGSSDKGSAWLAFVNQ